MLRGCVLDVQPGELLHPRLGERGCWCGDAVEFVAIFWDVLASWILDTSSPATLRQQQPPFLATCVCGVPREVLGAAWCWCQAGCWSVAACLRSRAALACGQALPEPRGRAWVHLSRLVPAPLQQLDLMHSTRFDAWLVFVGISPFKRKKKSL